jgi:thiol-disulfide isomerase/thioredoxin
MACQALILAALMASAAPAGAALPAPQLGIASFDQLPKPLPYPYDPSAKADRAVDEARERAIARHKLLLIDLGGNWCADCRILAGTMALPRLKSFVEEHYEVVMVDIGRFDRNTRIAPRYGVTGRLLGVPAVLVVDPRTNRLINQGHTAALVDARLMTPQALADWLAGWLG